MIVPMNFLAEDTLKEVKFSPSITDLKEKGYKNVYVLTNAPAAFSDSLLRDCDAVLSDLDSIKESDIRTSVFFVYFSRGDYALPFLEKIFEEGGAIVSPNSYGKVPYWMNSNCCIDIYNEIGYRLQKQPKGSIQELGSIMQGIEATQNLEGDYVEIGVFSGTSALAALSYMQRHGIKRTCYLLDTYAGFTYDEAESSQDIKWSKTHTSWAGIKFDPGSATKRIKRLTSDFACNVIPLEFNVCKDPLPEGIKNIAMANLDVDIYEATYAGLCKLAPLMVQNGIITTEDPCSTHGLYGAYYALHKFLKSDIGKEFICLRSESTYFLIKR